MLAWAQTNWVKPAPAYLTLLGDGHWNFKSYNLGLYGTAPELVPPYMVFEDPWNGLVPADGLYGDINGDDIPDIAVGRIPVNDLTEAQTVLNKIIAYDDPYTETLRTAAWQKQSVFVADVADPNAGNFPQLSDDIIRDYLPADQTPQRIYLPSAVPPDPANTKAAIAAAINAGAFMIQYTGHGAVWRWSGSAIWTTSDVPGLINGSLLPVEMTFDCLDGMFSDPRPANWSLAEVMVRRPGGGTVASLSPAGLSLVGEQTPLRQRVMDTLFKQGVRELGRALTIAKQRFYIELQGGSGRPDTLIYTMTLLGDPAMRIPDSGDRPKAPLASAMRSDSSLALSWPAVTYNISNEPTTITGYGIWRSTTPYFNPADAVSSSTQVTTTLSLSWTDDGSVGSITPIGDVDNNYFYVVRAKNGSGWSANSNRVGEFDFAIVPGS